MLKDWISGGLSLRFGLVLMVLNFSLSFKAASQAASQVDDSSAGGAPINAYGYPLERLSYVMTDLRGLDELGIPALERDEVMKVGLAAIPSAQMWRLVARSHRLNRCGGFQLLESAERGREIFQSLRMIETVHKVQQKMPLRAQVLSDPSELMELISRADEAELRKQVDWISSYRSRFHRLPDPNQHVIAMESKLKQILASSGLRGEVSLITHQRTPQKTVRLRIEGATRPQETVVIGAHYDSIAGWSGSSAAPGADDDASGSANILEAARILLLNGRAPARSLEFFWYAGEEGGLIGSGEIADAYSRDRRDVVAVLQLDMTLFPGNGEHVIGNITDYTNPWLREYFRQLNEKFLKVRLVDDECGYGCSDHASWHNRGFPTLLPFEATSNTMNRNIHTARDVVDSRLSFVHANHFTKLALLFAWDLGNSSLRPAAL